MPLPGLDQEQTDIYYAWENNLRALVGEQARLNDKMAALNTQYTAQIQGILVDLEDNTVAPNTSGLAGSSSLDSDAEAVTIMAHVQGILTNYNTSGHRQLWAKAAGINGLL